MPHCSIIQYVPSNVPASRSFFNLRLLLVLIGTLQYGSCVIQPTKISFSSEELIDMIHRCGLNRLNQFATFLANNLRASRSDPKLLSLLSNLDDIIYSGLPLAREEEDWAYKNGMKLRVSCHDFFIKLRVITMTRRTCLAALSVVACSCPLGLLVATLAYFNPWTGSPTVLFPPLLYLQIRGRSPQPDFSNSSSLPNPRTVLTSPFGTLMETSTQGICSRRPHLDSTFLGDEMTIGSNPKTACGVIPSMLFLNPVCTISVTDQHHLCRAIEENALAMCGNLIAECIVVGSGRPSPVMFVEPAVDTDHGKLKKEIIRKTRHFHTRRYLHERITSVDMIVVVPRQTLPRTATKGNIRRKAVEESYKIQLDQIFERTR